jgi:hypothetical protein
VARALRTAFPHIQVPHSVLSLILYLHIALCLPFAVCLHVTLLFEQQTAPWLLFTSSREVFGDTKDFKIDEHSTHNPLNVYGTSKVLFVVNVTLRCISNSYGTLIGRLRAGIRRDVHRCAC